MDEINEDPHVRQELDLILRSHIRTYLATETISVDEIVFLLTRSLAELANPSVVTGHLIAAYALAAERGQEPIFNPKSVQDLSDCPSYKPL